MADDPAIPLSYGRSTPAKPRLRWLILLVAWTIGLAVWAVYMLLIAWVLTTVFL